jgi:hypothetical protein
LAAGELIFVSNTNRLFIGNGTTLGGVPVTDYTDEQARDIAASIFVAGTHNSITFAYDDALDKINATVDLSDYQGVIKAAAFNGSVVANDSSLLIDGNTGKFNLSGSVGTDIIPDTDLAYDLGSATYRFRDLYLSGSSIKLGAAIITATGTAVNLPAGSTIGGSEIGIPGGDLNVNIVADDSTVIVNTTTEVVTAQGGFVGNVTGNVTGYHTGDVKGSVFADDSTLLVDAVSGTISATSITGNIFTNLIDSANSSAITFTPAVIFNSDVTVDNELFANLTGNVKGNVTGNVTGAGNIDISGRITTSEIATTLTSVASGVCTLASVAGLAVGMPIVFNYVSQVSGALGNIIPGITFYILTINTGLSQITISRSRSGSQFATGTSSSTTMNVIANGIDTGIMTANCLNVNSMLVFRDMTYPAITTTTYQIAGIGSYFVFGNASTPNNFVFNADSSDQPFTIRGVTDGFLGAQPALTLGASRGTNSVPLIVQNGDSTGLIRFNAYTGSGTMAGYANGAFISAFVSDTTIAAADAFVDTTLMMGNIGDVASGKYTTFAPGGIVTIPVTTRKLSADNNNWITVASTTTYSLSTTVSKNMLLVGTVGLTATLTFPSANLIDGQELSFTVITNTVILALTVGPTLVGTFAGSTTAGTTIKYVYRTSNASWYKIQ